MQNLPLRCSEVEVKSTKDYNENPKVLLICFQVQSSNLKIFRHSLACSKITNHPLVTKHQQAHCAGKLTPSLRQHLKT